MELRISRLRPAAGTSYWSERTFTSWMGGLRRAVEIEVNQTIETTLEVATSTLAAKPASSAPANLAELIERLRAGGVNASRHT